MIYSYLVSISEKMYVCIIRMELNSTVRSKFYSTENMNLLKGVVNQFLNDKHNVNVDENTYSAELVNIMSTTFRNSHNSDIYHRLRDSPSITKELNKSVITKIIPSIQNKLFKNVAVPPRPGSTKNENIDTYSTSQFNDGFIPPHKDTRSNIRTLPDFNSVEYPHMSDNTQFEDVGNLYQKAIESRDTNPNVKTPQFEDPLDNGINSEKLANSYNSMLQDRGIPNIIPNKTNSIPQQTAPYDPKQFSDMNQSYNKNSLPCPEGEVKPPMVNINSNKYNKQSSLQNDDNSSFDEGTHNIDKNIEQVLIERTAHLQQLSNEGFENGLINSAKENDSNNKVVSLTAPTSNQVSVLGQDAALEKGNYEPPKKDESEKNNEVVIVKDTSGIEPIDSFNSMKTSSKEGFSIEEKEKLEKRLKTIEDMYNQKLLIPKTLTNQDDLVESVSYITIDSADRNRTNYANPHSYTILLDSQSNSHNMGVLKNVVSAKLIGITIPKSNDMEKLRYLYLNVDQFGSSYIGSNKTASNAFARLKFERTFRHRTMGTGAFVSPDLDDVTRTFPGTTLNNIDRLSISFSKPNGDAFSFGTDLGTATDGSSHAAGSGATITAITSVEIAGANVKGKSDNVLLTVDNATGLSEGQAITISGLSATGQVSATDDLNGDHIIKEINGTSVMLETSWTGSDAADTITGTDVLKTWDASNVCEAMQHSMTFRIGSLVRRNQMNNSDDGTRLVEGDQMVLASMGSGGVGSLMGIRKCTGGLGDGN